MVPHAHEEPSAYEEACVRRMREARIKARHSLVGSHPL
jgi:hypothetical protein